ncbi:MAG TPA: MerR family transcriptional regulator [Phycisphaerae bacterium]|nr:MerR family transcriptional regulator [Phycisphaerae bacterium]
MRLGKMGNPGKSNPSAPAHRIDEYLRHIALANGHLARQAGPSVPPKLYRVSEIAQHLDITRQTVHNYATIGLITEEAQTPGGQRLFDESVFDRLVQIQRLKRRYRLSQIRRLLDTGGASDSVAAPAADASNSADRLQHGKDAPPRDA